MNSRITAICVFCGSADNLNEEYLTAARDMGVVLAKKGIQVIYGGGKTGLMGALADGALDFGGEVIGIVPEGLNLGNLIHSELTQLEITPDMHTRKARMHALANAFIALPGGYGTWEELLETITWAQIGLHTKPIGILNTKNYYDPFIEMVREAAKQGFIFNQHVDLFVHDRTPDNLVNKLCAYKRPADLDRWVNR